MRRRGHSGFGFIIAAILILSVWSGVSHAGWYTPVTVSSGNVGYRSDIAVDRQRKVHVGYHAGSGSLMYANNSSGTWANEQISAGGDYTSIAAGANGDIFISYVDPGSNLDVAARQSGVWSNDQVDLSGNISGATSIAVDSTGALHVSYGDLTFGLKYAKGTPGSWGTYIAGAGNIGSVNSLALDSIKNVYVSYYDPNSNNGDLMCAMGVQGSSGATGPTWSIFGVDYSSDDAGSHNSIAMDANDTAHISYYDTTTGNLMYARGTNGPSGFWITDTVDSSGDVGRYNSIAVDANGNVHISYQDSAAGGHLKYAMGVPGASGMTWSASTIDSTGNTGYDTAIAVDAGNMIHIMYRDANTTGGGLKYIYNGYDLTVAKSGAGQGSVTSSIPGINCDLSNTDCGDVYGPGSVVTLHAVPQLGSYFGGWSWNCSAGTCTSNALSVSIAMDQTTTVTATFTSTPPSVNTWAKTFGGGLSGQSQSIDLIQQTRDSGYIGVGKIYNLANGYDDFWVVKLDNAGGVQWQNRYEKYFDDTYTPDNDQAHSIQQTSDGGYIVAGDAHNLVDIDAWLLKLDKDGNIEWDYTYKASFGPDHAYAVRPTADGGYILAGSTPGISVDQDLWLVKLDAGGSPAWSKKYGTSGMDEARDIKQTSDGGYIVIGANGSGVGSDIWIMKLDGKGNYEWQQIFGGGSSFPDEGRSVEQTRNGEYLAAGLQSGLFWAARLYADGSVRWEKTFGTSGSANSIHETLSGDIIVAGEDNSSIWAMYLTPNGDLGTQSWQNTYQVGSASDAASIQQAADGGFVCAGGYIEGEDHHVLFMKLDLTGDIAGCSGVAITPTSDAGSPVSEDGMPSYVDWQSDFALSRYSLFNATAISTTQNAFVCGSSHVNWKVPVDGNWDGESGFNWDTGSEPTSVDDAFITIPCTGSCTSGYQVHLYSMDTTINSLTIGDGSTSPGQTLYIDGQTLTLNSASIINQNGQITLDNAAALNGSATLTIDGILYLFGNTTINPSVSLGGGDIVVNYGNNLLNGPLTTQSASRLAVIAVTGGIDAQLAVAGGFTNNGLIELNYNVAGPTASLLINSGTLSNSSTGIIQGRGTLNVSAASFSNAGAINPGASPGVLNINGNFSQQTSGVLNIEIGGTTVGSEYDRLNVSGAATLAGTLNVSLAGGFNPPAGSSFTILTYGTRSGNFGAINLPTLSGRTWTVNYGSGALTLTVDPITYTLSVAKDGAGSGTVVSSETPNPLINCGGTCSAIYDANSSVTLAATPAQGSIFAGWSGGTCSGTGNCQVTMNGNRTIYATFAKQTNMVTTTAGQGGSISPASASVDYGGTAQFTVTPDDNYHIASVTGCGVTKYQGGVIAAKKKKKVKSSAVGEVYVTAPVTADCTVSANFAINTFTVTPDAGEHGSVNPGTPQTVNYNGTASFDITAAEGYHIESVSGCGGTAYTAIAKKKKKKKLAALSQMTYTTGKVTGDCSVTAAFAINSFKVTSKTGDHGSIDPAGVQTVNYHDSVSFTVTPDTGYHISSVSGCGVQLVDGNIYTTEPVTGDCTVEAAFAAEIFTASILKSGSGNGAVTGSGLTCEGETCTGSYETGSKLILKIKPDAGSRIIDVKINGKSIGAIQTITLKEIISNFTIEIVFGPA